MPELDLARGWRIVADTRHPTAALAAAELEETLTRIAGHSRERGEGGGLEIALSHRDGRGDGFRWRASRDGIELTGDGPRGLLCGAYSVLEALGCRWAWPGSDGELLSRDARLELPEEPVREQPALPGRCLILGHRAFLEECEKWIVWAARNRLDTLFIHVSMRPEPAGAAPEALWRERSDRALALARERGMTIEHGGHLLPELLPDDVSTRLPDAVSETARGRSSSADATLRAMRRTLEEHFRAHPGVDVFHLWGEDLPPESGQRGRRDGPGASERALLIANAAAEVLERVDRSARLAFLAYHDTEEVPARVRPRANVCLVWAPRERCYAHPANDERCLVNVPRYRDLFLAQVEHFRSAGAAPPRVFEYYLDAILFARGVPPLGRVIRGDLGFYREAGAHTVQALMTGFEGWRDPHPNPWLFARLAWDPRQDPDALVYQFCEAAFGASDAAMRAERYRELEERVASSIARGHGGGG
jgi:hypothetical protein